MKRERAEWRKTEKIGKERGWCIGPPRTEMGQKAGSNDKAGQ